MPKQQVIFITFISQCYLMRILFYSILETNTLAIPIGPSI